MLRGLAARGVRGTNFPVRTGSKAPWTPPQAAPKPLADAGDLGHGTLALAADQRPVIGARLLAHLPAREGQADDRALHHPELLVEGPGVVGQAVALADLAHLRGDLAVAGARHVGVEVML